MEERRKLTSNINMIISLPEIIVRIFSVKIHL